MKSQGIIYIRADISIKKYFFLKSLHYANRTIFFSGCCSLRHVLKYALLPGKTKTNDANPLTMDTTYNKLIRFYIPLALTSVMMNLSAPILNSAISLSADSISQIAAFAVAFAVATLTHSPVFTVQQIAIAKATNRQNVRKLILYFLVISIVLININALFAFTPLGDLLFMKFMGASEAVSSSAKLTLAAFLPLPLFITFRGVFQGMLLVILLMLIVRLT